MSEAVKIIESLFNPAKPEEPMRLPETPKREDLLPFLGKRLRSKRLRKKFIDHFDVYVNNKHFIPVSISKEFYWKRWMALGQICAEEIYSTLGREDFAQKILKFEPQVNVVRDEKDPTLFHIDAVVPVTRIECSFSVPIIAVHEDETWTDAQEGNK
jgi:hypothetical protein